jgi:hypothetical protein
MVLQAVSESNLLFTHLGDDRRYAGRYPSYQSDALIAKVASGGFMRTLRIAAVLAWVCTCLCAFSAARTMKEGGGGGGAHYCIKRDTATPQGTRKTYVAIRNTCGKEVTVIACGILERSFAPKNDFVGKVARSEGYALKQNEYVDPTVLGWVCEGSGCDNWTFVWNAEYADSGIIPTSPMKNEAKSGH